MEDVDDFLVHYGIKGMKWGVRRSNAVLDRNAARRSSGKSGSDQDTGKPKRQINKKKVALGVGIVAATAAVTVGAVMLSQNQSKRDAGKSSAMEQMKKMGGQSSWDVISGVSVKAPGTPTPKPTLAQKRQASGEAAVKRQMQEFAGKSKWDIMTDPKSSKTQVPGLKPAPAKEASKSDSTAKKKFQTPGQKKKAGEAIVAAQMQSFAKKSMWDLAVDTNLKAAPKKTTYSKKAQQKDAKLYGAKNAKQISKQVGKGVPLADAKKKAALKKYGPVAAKVALNVGAATLKDKGK